MSFSVSTSLPGASKSGNYSWQILMCLSLTLAGLWVNVWGGGSERTAGLSTPKGWKQRIRLQSGKQVTDPNYCKNLQHNTGQRGPASRTGHSLCGPIWFLTSHLSVSTETSPGLLEDPRVQVQLIDSFQLCFISSCWLLATLGAQSGPDRSWPAKKKTKQKSAIEFSSNRQAHVQMFTSHFKCLFVSFFRREFIWRRGSLHRSTLSCLGTMQQYFCGGGGSCSPCSPFNLGSVSSFVDSSVIMLVQQKKAATSQCCAWACGWVSPVMSQLKTCVCAVHSAGFH